VSDFAAASCDDCLVDLWAGFRVDLPGLELAARAKDASSDSAGWAQASARL